MSLTKLSEKSGTLKFGFPHRKKKKKKKTKGIKGGRDSKNCIETTVLFG